MDDALKTALLEALFFRSEAAYLALDAGFVVKSASKGFYDLTGRPADSLPGAALASLLGEEGAANRLIQAVKTAPILRNYETVLTHGDGAHERVFATVRALGEGGHLLEIVPALEDLGESPDNRTIQETLVKMERFSAVGRMTAAFAHEMRTPVHVIASMAELVLGDLPEGAPQRENIEMILRNAGHASLSIRALLDFSKVGKSQLRKGSLNEVFRFTLDLIGKLFEKQDIAVELESGEIPDLLMDAQNMRAVVHSLLINAVDAMPGGGRLSILTRISPKTGGASFSIADTGQGMSSEVLSRIGSAFFTTKENGTGLGLYLTKRVLAEHGAEITFASTEGAGSTVTVDFPKED